MRKGFPARPVLDRLLERPFLSALGLVVVVKTGFWLLDHQPLFYLNDSASYLYTALEGWIPSDRSFTYGYVLSLLTQWPPALGGMVLGQTVFGIGSCLILFWILFRYLNVPLTIVLPAAFLAALDPGQLLYERHVMTEATALLVLAVTLLLAARYLERRKLLDLFWIQLASLALVSLRFSYFLFAIVITFWLPWVAYRQEPREKRIEKGPFRALLAPSMVSILLLVAFHSGYRWMYGEITDGPSVYSYYDGFFQLAAITPLLKPEDASDPRVEQVINDDSGLQLDERRNRTRQLWQEDGIVRRLMDRVGEPRRANRLARETAIRAIRRDPLGFLQLGWATYTDYWNGARYESVVRPETEAAEIPPGRLPEGLAQTLHEEFSLDPSTLSPEPTITQRWYRSARPWFLVILASPVLVLAGLYATRGRERALVSVLALVPVTILPTVCLVGGVTRFRHLHQLSWLTLILLVVLVNRLLANRPKGIPEGPAGPGRESKDGTS